jgi:uncharacterized protein
MSSWQIAFGEVRHTRLRPVRHAFVYPAFFLRIPIHELAGSDNAESLYADPSSAWFGVNRAGLMSFHESDHGNGNADRGSNWRWVQTLLKEASLPAPSQVWLHAFPRIFGYAFKPVSFWFCHDSEGKLNAIIAEVRNTFGEKHIYLLSGDPRFGQTLTASKVFHVSPFCNVEGGYTFRFLNTPDRTVARVDHQDKQGPLVLTSMSGRLTDLATPQVFRALLKYPLFTFGVMARIHWQALLLWRKRVPFFSKPKPPANTISHNHS